MKTVLRLSGFFLSLLVLALIGFACSDDEGPTGGGEVDKNPPVVTGVVGLNRQNVQVTFNEKVNGETAERADNYLIVEPAGTAAPGRPERAGAAPGDTIWVATAALSPDGKQVLLATWSWMNDVDYEVTVKGIKDLNGNQMTGASITSFTGSTVPDNLAPEIVSRSPAPDATGVGTGQSVLVRFSEPMNGASVFTAFSWSSGGTQIPVTMQDRGNEFAFTPLLTLQLNSQYNIAISNAAMDWAGNPLTATNWSFRTTSSPDVTPPTLASSSPADGAVNVPTGSSFKLTFSETIDPLSAGENDILVTPSPGNGTPYWSNGGKTITFEPDEPLMNDTQYLTVIPQGSIRDLAGNGFAESITIQFTTGSSFAAGSILGRVDGDPFSDDASNPVGAVVIAPDRTPFEDDDDLQIFGAEFVGADSSYAIGRLPDNWYFPFTIMDSNGDGRLDPDLGDAIGAYGVDIRGMDTEYDSVRITGGNTVSDVDMKLFDPMVVAGKTVYVGGNFTAEELLAFSYSVGLFDTSTFDTSGGVFPSPDHGISGASIVYDSKWRISQLDIFPPLTAGTYWVGAYMDVGGTPDFEPDIDPSGIYMNPATKEWIPVTIENGTDALDISIYLVDPESGGTSQQSAWRKPDDTDVPESVERLRRIQAWMRRSIDASRAGR